MKNIEKIYKTAFYIFTFILLIGLLAGSGVLYAANRQLPPAALSADPAAVELRLSLRGLANAFSGIGSMVFALGNVIFLCSFVKLGKTIKTSVIFLSFISVISLMFICVTPFAIIDRAFASDYLFPLWSTIIIYSILFVILLLFNSAKAKYRRNTRA